MKARLLGLLKLLLQVVLFLASGRWVRFGDERRALEKELESRRQRAKAPRPPARPRRRVFDARRSGPPPLLTPRGERLASGREQGSRGDLAAPWDKLALPDTYAPRHEGPRAHAKRRASTVPEAPGAAPRPRSLAATVRDPRALQESVAIGEALGPRRSPR